MIEKLDRNVILELYNKYSTELKNVRGREQRLYLLYERIPLLRRVLRRCIPTMHPQLDDIEAEITYMLIRESKPKNIVEISPCGGWSTSWILNALKDNDSGKLYSYDIIDNSTKTIPKSLSDDRWTFIQGDIKENVDKLPENIDYLFMDSDHSARFAQWYTKNIFPKLAKGTYISVHDIFHQSNASEEGEVVIELLKQMEIEYFTAAPTKEKQNYDEIMSIKRKLGIDKLIHPYEIDSMIFFIYR